MSCGSPWASSEVVKAGTGGREGVLGAAFSLSPVCDVWLEPGAGREGVWVLDAESDWGGGLGNSLMICEYGRQRFKSFTGFTGPCGNWQSDRVPYLI